MSTANETIPAPVGGPKDNQETVWTIMVYLAGDNNLADEGVYALTEMKAVDTGEGIRVVAQFDPSERKVRTRRFEINRGKDPALRLDAPGVLGEPRRGGNGRRGRIIEDALEEVEEGAVKFPGARSTQLQRPTGTATATAGTGGTNNDGESDTGDPKTLFDFISWTVEHHPADHYMVVLSGHGGGIEEEFLRDETSRRTLSIAELGRVFAAVRSELKDKNGEPLLIDILGMDSCLMSMAEVCYELFGSVKYMISSESFGAQSGWPYGRVLARLSEALAPGGDVSAEDLASIVVNEHVDFYTDYAVTDGLSVDISVMDVEKVEDLVTEIRKLSTILIEELQAGAALKQSQPGGALSEFLDQIVLAHWEAQSYNGELFADLQDFCECLRKRSDPARVPEAPAGDERAALEREAAVRSRQAVQDGCDNVINAIESLVRRACYTGITYQYSNGVSIYFPWAEVAPDYTDERLKFVAPSGWRDFLDTYVAATRRVPRGFRPNEIASVREDEEKRIRKTPLDGRTPSNVIVRSMRNPPNELFREGVSSCVREQPQLLDLLDIAAGLQ